ncbi:PH domain-containing protein DDB_G0287875-like [Helianthus annuus]|uniref:PH domain-containing protein DDB_G0287875-like n=1 Tax=Helianthus annuus TaxID=4232 RepID=UPI00165333D5|nr:PH domain-containing protein DDB_G0287875-like [Helianthus annuus]
MKDKIYRTWKEAKSAKIWDADRECYLDPKGNIVVEPSSISVETLIEQIAEEEEEEEEEEEARQRMWAREAEEKLKSKKVDDGIIDTTKEFTADNLKKMADKVLAAKELEVDSKSGTESKNKVSSNDSTNESERIRKENEKLIHENRQLSKNYEKLNRTIKDSDERNDKTTKENLQLSGVLQSKEKKINQQVDEIANLKLQFQEASIENERINLKLNSYNSASFVLQHNVPKPIGKNKADEDVYSDGTGVGYHQFPPQVLNNFSKKKSGLVNDNETNEVKLPETIDVTFTSSFDEDSVQSEVVKSMVENVLKSESDLTKEEECLNNYIPKSTSKNNLSEEPTLVMYKMSGSDKLYSDIEFPLKNVNVDKLKNVFKLVEIDVSEIEGKKYVPKKDQPSGQPQKDEFFLYKEVEVRTEESLKMNDKNFPPLYTKTIILNVKLLESKEAWNLPRSISRWIMDSGASQHMTGKKTLLYDVRGFNGGYVGFAGNQGGRIVGEGTFSNGIVTFERVNYIAELENNLLSISQICDRMYSTHFMDKECLILKPGFVVPEEWVIM